MIKSNKWKKRFISLAKSTADWSKDPSTKVGAIAVNDKLQVISQGYNGFPRGIADRIERLNDRETKYKLIVHAEMNIIYNACYNGLSLENSTVFIYGLPLCPECAKGLIQCGVKKIVMKIPIENDLSGKWETKFNEETCKMLLEADVKWEFIQ